MLDGAGGTAEEKVTLPGLLGWSRVEVRVVGFEIGGTMGITGVPLAGGAGTIGVVGGSGGREEGEW